MSQIKEKIFKQLWTSVSVARAHVKIKHVSKNMSPQSSVGQANCTQLCLCLKVCDWGMGDQDHDTSDEDTGRTIRNLFQPHLQLALWICVVLHT